MTHNEDATKVGRNKGLCALSQTGSVRGRLLSLYLHVESRHNETHVLTVDAAPGADLKRDFQEERAGKREEKELEERRARTSG